MLLVPNKRQRADAFPAHLLRSVTEAEVAAVSAALDDRWSIDCHEDVDGNVALLLTPSDTRNSDMVFYIDGIGESLNLSLMQSDELHYRGCYDNVDALVAAMPPRH